MSEISTLSKPLSQSSHPHIPTSKSSGNMDTTNGGKISATGDTPSAPIPSPAPIPSANSPPPFLVKTYDMVDDTSTDKIVSWSDNNNSFVVWDLGEFTKELLPKYFKHNNFSSFVRQLNTYGFRKVDSDRWEFANDFFLRGQKHLLKNIIRRKPVHGHNQRPQQSNAENSSVSPCVEVGNFGLKEEVERLKRDKNVLMQELVRLRQQQQTTDNHLQKVVQRLEGMEQRQQQMMSFLAKAANSPGFLAQFVQQQNEGNKKRRLRQDGEVSVDQSVSPPDGQIIKYQPLILEDAQQLGTLDNGSDGFLISDISSPPSEEIDLVGSSTSTTGVTIHEVPPTSGQSYLQNNRIPEENFVGPEIENGAVLAPNSLELGNFSPDTEIEWNDSLLDDIFSTEASWEQFLAPSPQAVDAEPMESVAWAEENESKPLENGSSKDQMSQLTEQMGLLRPDTENV